MEKQIKQNIKKIENQIDALEVYCSSVQLHDASVNNLIKIEK